METIKIFLASSFELKDDRDRFGDFFNDLNRAFKPAGIDFELVKWENLDSAFNGGCKEDEYLKEVKKCQLFIALFQTIAGKYTQQELEIAYKSFDIFGEPKILVYVKDLEEGQERTKDFDELMDKLLFERQYMPETYDNFNTLKLRLLTQLLLMIKDPSIKFEVKDSVVRVNGIPIAESKQK